MGSEMCIRDRGGGGLAARAGVGGGGGVVGGGGADDDGADASESGLSADEALSTAIFGLRAFPLHLASLLELIEAHAHRRPAHARGDGDDGGDVGDGEGDDGCRGADGAAPTHTDAASLERVPAELQPSYALPAVSAMLRTLRAVVACERLRHVDSPSRAHVGALLHALAQADGASRPSREPSDDELSALAARACDFCEAILPSLPCGTAALDVVELLLALAHVPAAASAQRTQLTTRAADAAAVLLGRAWASNMPKPRGAQIARLFHVALAHAPRPKAVLEEWVASVLPQFLAQVTSTCDGARRARPPPRGFRLRARAQLRAPNRARPRRPRARTRARAGEGYAAQQPLLSTKTIHLFYKPLTEQLLVLLGALELPIEPAAVERLGCGTLGDAVGSVGGVIALFAGLLAPSKAHGLETHAALLAHVLRMRCVLRAHTRVRSARVVRAARALKACAPRARIARRAARRSRQFLQLFNKRAMPFFTAAFSRADQREAISAALKSLQGCTRVVQSHCAQAKASRTVGALAQLPHVKKQLEVLLFSVKQMLAEHECTAAFWVGNLRHKTAAGELVGSQVEPVARRGANKASDAKGRAKKAAARRGAKPLEGEDEAVDIDDVTEAREASCGSDDDEGEGEGDECDGDDDEEGDDDDDEDEDE